ncbi:RagB/SusD family nutrient uptake outer membrane protein [Sphingobacterium pedocola]|nr:RagB/SusD family nutrient uptake outer membrane protein [Sphingobacterium pedocola]
MISCTKSDFLAEKPRSSMLVPSTVEDYQLLLNNPLINEGTTGLGLISSDDVYFDQESLEAISPLVRHVYLWDRDMYAGEQQVKDWNNGYFAVFIANNVIEGIEDVIGTTKNKRDVLGQAFFKRAYAYFDLATHFCEYVDDANDSQLGLPLRTTADVNVIEQRASLEQTFELIKSDLLQAKDLLIHSVPVQDKYRPSVLSCFALLSRMELYRGNYEGAEIYADSCLKLSDGLLDYNNIDLTVSNPFTSDHVEIIYKTTCPMYVELYGADFSPARVNPLLIELFNANEPRRRLYFGTDSRGLSYANYSYTGFSTFPFTGLATDEIYLIKAESATRNGNLSEAQEKFENFLRMRYSDIPYDLEELSKDKEKMMDMVLLERRKELVWRGSRWLDLKRLNAEGYSISVRRQQAVGAEFSLLPNDPKYIFSIPVSEINRSGITQNLR